MERGFGVARVEIDGAFERIGGAREIAGALLRHAEQDSRADCDGKKSTAFLRGATAAAGAVSVSSNAQIQIGFGHLWIDGSAFSYSARASWDLFQRGVSVSELEMRECDVGLFGDEFLQRRDGGGEIALVDVALGFVEIIVERIVIWWFLCADCDEREAVADWAAVG